MLDLFVLILLISGCPRKSRINAATSVRVLFDLLMHVKLRITGLTELILSMESGLGIFVAEMNLLIFRWR